MLNLIWLDYNLTVEEVAVWVKETKADRAAGEPRYELDHQQTGQAKRLRFDSSTDEYIIVCRRLNAALSALSRLHILIQVPGSQPQTLALNSKFKKHFRRALTGG